MPYPSKTHRQTILSAAVKELVHGGIRDLSLRNIAASLDLAPNAIYRYFPDRRHLKLPWRTKPLGNWSWP